MSRKKREEMAFGSDSFLDIVANIVGILIILIVVVGVRVAHSPAVGMSLVKEPVATPASVKPAPVKLSPPAELPELPQFPPLAEIRPDAEMMQRAESMREENVRLKSQLQSLDAEQKRLTQLRRAQADQTAALRKQINEKVDGLRNQKSQVATLETNVEELKAEIAALQKKLGEIDPDDAPVEKLTHELPPIGRVVSGDEVHFRLVDNKVTRVPVSQLVREVQRDINRRKEILISRSFYQGSTRPVEGYMMEYVLQRQAMTLADELRNGRGVVRVGVTGWVIKPVGPFHPETAEEALRSDSQFQRVLRQHGPTSTVTFWVYPDSFAIHSKLSKFAHDANFWVASRPLPKGVPIAGSPDGSKSVAQ